MVVARTFARIELPKGEHVFQDFVTMADASSGTVVVGCSERRGDTEVLVPPCERGRPVQESTHHPSCLILLQALATPRKAIP